MRHASKAELYILPKVVLLIATAVVFCPSERLPRVGLQLVVRCMQVITAIYRSEIYHDSTPEASPLLPDLLLI